MFRYGNWNESRHHWTRLGRELGIEARRIDDPEVAVIRDSLSFGPPNPLYVPDL